MTNEEKSKLLFQKYEDATILGEPLSRGSVAFQSSLEMAEWKERQTIDRAAEWIRMNFQGIIHPPAYLELFIEQFKKAMKEDL